MPRASDRLPDDVVAALSDLDAEDIRHLAQLAAARQDASVSRRDVGKAAAALGLGGVIGGAASTQVIDNAAAATGEAGTIGTASEPVDVEAQDINTLSTTTDKGNIKNAPASYEVYTDGSTIWGVPQDNPFGPTMSEVQDTDIGSFLTEIFTNQLPPQGAADEAAGKVVLKRGEYPGTLSQTVLPMSVTLEGEVNSHSRPSNTTSFLPSTEEPVRLNAIGHAFVPPSTDQLHPYPTVKHISIEGDGTSTCFAGGSLISLTGEWDWMRLEDVHTRYFDRPFYLDASNQDLPVYMEWCNFMGGSTPAIAGVNTRIFACTINGPVSLNDSTMEASILHQSGEDVSAGMVNANRGSHIHNCRFRKVNGTNGSGRCVTLHDTARVTSCTVYDSGDFGPPFYAAADVVAGAAIRDCVDQTASGNSVVIDTSATELYVDDRGLPNGVFDSGVRTLRNGVGENAGDPNSTGQWNGNGYEGAVVVDTTNSTVYHYRGGGWV